MHVTKITIGRLFNLGSYEHVRYELTAEVPAGESASTAMLGLERIIEALNPKQPGGVQSKGEIERGKARLKDEMEWTPERFEQYHGGVAGGRIVYFERVKKGIEEAEATLAAWEARLTKARKMLEDIGGAANWKYAKLDWENDCDF